MVDDPEAAPRSWVRDEAERIAFEQVLGGVAGRRINAVRYVELGYEEVPCEPFRTGPQFDWVDDALELDLDDGATWTIVWEHDTNVARPDGTVVENNGIIVHPGRLDWLQASEHTAVWDVTEHWHANGPRDIGVVTPVWVESRRGTCLGANSLGPPRGRFRGGASGHPGPTRTCASSGSS